jgi:DNA gyrase subunit B
LWCWCSISFDADIIRARLRELAFLNSSATILFRVRGQPGAAAGDGTQDDQEWETLHFGGGLTEYVTWLNRDKQLLHKPIVASRMVTSRRLAAPLHSDPD